MNQTTILSAAVVILMNVGSIRAQDFYMVMVGDTQYPRVTSQFDVKESKILTGAVEMSTPNVASAGECAKLCRGHGEDCSFTYILSTKVCEFKATGVAFADGTYSGYTSGLVANVDKNTFINDVSEGLNRNFIKSVTTLAGKVGTQNLRGIIVNGDLTEYGQSDQLSKFKELYAAGNLPATLYPGLGNHDYANNVSHCYENNCANRMPLFLRDEVKNRLRLDSFDYSASIGYQFPTIRNIYEGSFAYSWDVENVHFVQLNNFPGYTNSWESYVSSVTPDGSAGARTFAFKITPAYKWLRADLTKARHDGKAIILNFHDASEHWSNTDRADFDKLVTDYDVSAVFVGHIHQCVARSCVDDGRELLSTSGRAFQPNYSSPTSQTYGSAGQVPWFYSGAPHYNTYLAVKFSGPTMTVFPVFSGDGGATYLPGLLTTAALKTPRKDVALPLEAGYVTFFNESGYVARYQVTYLLNGTPQQSATGNVALGSRTKIDIPAGATSVKVLGEGQTGLQDSSVFNIKAWNTTFSLDFPTAPNKCFKSYGTTLSQKWDNNCQ